MSDQLKYDDDAAPAPPAPGSGYPSSRPPHSTTGKKGPNDVRVKPANPDVISDLLDSFDVISSESFFPSPVASPRNASRPRTPPPKTSRPTSRGSQRTSMRPPSIKPSNLTHSFTEVPYPTEDPSELPPGEDAAEPPVIRTARPPSGFSKMTSSRSGSQQSNLRRKLSSPRIMLSPPPERNTSQRPSTDSRKPRTVRESRESSTSPHRLGSVTENTDRPQDEFSLTASHPPSAFKGKERQAPSSKASSLRSSAYESQRAPNDIRSPPNKARAQPTSSVRPSNDTERSAFMGKEAHSRSTPHRLVISDDEPQAETGRDVNGTVVTPGKPDGRAVPERRSSLKGPGSPSPMKRQSSLHSNKSSPDARRKQAPPIEEERVPNRVIVNEDSDNDETLRRIRELKAAREQRELRQSSMKASSDPSKADASRSHTMPAQQSTILAPKTSKQLREAREVEEHRISDEMERSRDNYTLNVPPTTVAPSKPFAKPSSNSAFSDQRSPPPANANASRAAASKSSFETPKHSRTNSWSKRWSPLPFGSKAEPTPRQSTSVAPQSPLASNMSGVDDRRASTDSIENDVNAYLSSPRLSQRVNMPGERRKVMFSEVGDPKGHAILCCVGMGLTRYVMAFYDELATSLGLRILTLDRPGIGGSDSYLDGPKIPMSWPDDVLALCEQLEITKFSLLAHSAGAVYALATALRLPHYLRGKIHLLAPWIPPSQLVPPTSTITSPNDTKQQPAGALPKSQRFLRILPSSFLKLSNSTFGFHSRSSSPKPSKSNTPKRGRRSTESGPNKYTTSSRRDSNATPPVPSFSNLPSSTTLSHHPSTQPAPHPNPTQPPTPRLESFRDVPQTQHSIATALQNGTTPGAPDPYSLATSPNYQADARKARQKALDAKLTPAIWHLATTNANPSVDLLICLERHRPIGFSYSEVGAKPAVKTLGERAGKTIDAGPTGAEVDGNQWPGMGVVITHGVKDGRVPVENVRWLGGRMGRCEVRELEGLGHGLMGEAGVMGGVLGEMGAEAQRWGDKGGRRR